MAPGSRVVGVTACGLTREVPRRAREEEAEAASARWDGRVYSRVAWLRRLCAPLPLQGMFHGATSFVSDLSEWDVSQGTESQARPRRLMRGALPS